MGFVILGILGVVGFLALGAIFSGFFTVEQQTHAIVERFGKFQKICGPGLGWKTPFITRVAGRITHRIRELEIKVESKTKDDVFVDLLIAVQFYVSEEESAIMSSHYKLMNPGQQISSYVFDTVRSIVPEMHIDQVFSEKERIAAAVRDRLHDTMEKFGFIILQSLVHDIQPDAKVKTAMNAVNASARMREAARNEAEAKKIRVIAEAEAEARAKELQGVGIARQRLAIAKGLKESVEACSAAGISQEEATNMVLMTQHYDTVTAVGANSKSIVMMLPYAPEGMTQVGSQIMTALKGKPDAEHHSHPLRPLKPPQVAKGA